MNAQQAEHLSYIASSLCSCLLTVPYCHLILSQCPGAGDAFRQAYFYARGTALSRPECPCRLFPRCCCSCSLPLPGSLYLCLPKLQQFQFCGYWVKMGSPPHQFSLTSLAAFYSFTSAISLGAISTPSLTPSLLIRKPDQGLHSLNPTCLGVKPCCYHSSFSLLFSVLWPITPTLYYLAQCLMQMCVLGMSPLRSGLEPSRLHSDAFFPK